ncbi:hypothetical protein [Staphylococcus epidermidis]|nr:hypothetical protein [Staphylococcus epidermidis]
MEESKDEVDSEKLDKYSLKESCEEEELKKIECGFKEEEAMVLR